MELINILFAIAPKVIEIAKEGQAAWAEFIETKKIVGNDELNAKLDSLKEDFVRIRLIAEAEANN